MKRALLVLIVLAVPTVALATIPSSGTVDLATQSDGKLRGQTPNEHLRGNVSAIGDFNGDGVGDFAVVVGESPRATVRVVFGSAALDASLVDDKSFSGATGLVVTSASRYLTAVAGAGDVNGDGKADLVMGSCDLLAGDDAAAGGDGRGWVLFGRAATNAVDVDGASFGGFRIDGSGTECLGRAVAGAGDTNGDGKADVILGANTAQSTKGRAVVVYGKSDEATVSDSSLGIGGFDAVGPSGGNAGTFVAGVGDVNGDGKADVGVGSRNYDGIGTDSGAVWVLFGRAGGNASVTLDQVGGADTSGFRIDGPAQGSFLAAVAPAGDVNKDGKADVAVGAPGSPAAGMVAVVFGRTAVTPVALATLAAADGYRFTTSSTTSKFGFDVRGGQDLNADGTPDILAGAPSSSVGTSPEMLNAGRAYALFGRPGGGDVSIESLGTSGVAFLGTRGESSGGQAQDPSQIGFEGWMGLGDVSGDGKADVLLGTGAGTLAGGTKDPGTIFLVRQAAAATGGTPTPTPGPGATPTPGPGGGVTGEAPVISKVKLTAKKFRIGRRATAISSKKKKPPFGTTVRFNLSLPATVTFQLSCYKPKKKQKKSCPKLAKHDTMTRKVTTAGTTTFSFTGRIGKKPLVPGGYAMAIQAKSAGGRLSEVVTVKMVVVR